MDGSRWGVGPLRMACCKGYEVLEIHVRKNTTYRRKRTKESEQGLRGGESEWSKKWKAVFGWEMENWWSLIRNEKGECIPDREERKKTGRAMDGKKMKLEEERKSRRNETEGLNVEGLKTSREVPREENNKERQPKYRIEENV